MGNVYSVRQSEVLVGIFAQDHDDPTDTNHAAKPFGLTSLKLLEGRRDVVEAREEDIYNLS
jgi:hypothetical protein